MTIWDKVRKGVGQVASEVSQAADGLRLQTEMANVENELARIYADAGKRAKQLWREKRVIDADLDMLLRHTDELEVQLEELRKQSMNPQAEQKPTCPQCKAEVAEGVKFCPECGAKLGA